MDARLSSRMLFRIRQRMPLNLRWESMATRLAWNCLLGSWAPIRSISALQRWIRREPTCVMEVSGLVSRPLTSMAPVELSSGMVSSLFLVSCFEIREITDTNCCTGISMTLRRSTWNFSLPRLTRQCRLSILSFILRSPRLKEEMLKAHQLTRSFPCLLTQRREFTNTALVCYDCRHCRVL